MKNHTNSPVRRLLFGPLERRVQQIVHVECSVWRQIMLIEMKITLLANYQFFFYTLREALSSEDVKNTCAVVGLKNCTFSSLMLLLVVL